MPLCLYCSHCRFQPATFPDPDWNWGGLVTSRFLCLLCFWLQISSNQWLQYVSMSWRKEVNNLKLLRVAQLLITQSTVQSMNVTRCTVQHDKMYTTTALNLQLHYILCITLHHFVTRLAKWYLVQFQLICVPAKLKQKQCAPSCWVSDTFVQSFQPLFLGHYNCCTAAYHCSFYTNVTCTLQLQHLHLSNCLVLSEVSNIPL